MTFGLINKCVVVKVTRSHFLCVGLVMMEISAFDGRKEGLLQRARAASVSGCLRPAKGNVFVNRPKLYDIRLR